MFFPLILPLLQTKDNRSPLVNSSTDPRLINRRVYPSDLIQLISKAAEIEKESIGNIKILDNYSFVNIAGNVADKVVGALDTTEYRGRKLTVNFARKDA